MWPFTKYASIRKSGVLQGMTDYHSHLLPGVDDGVKTVEESLQILALYEELGLESVWLTPHIMEDIPNATQDLKIRFHELISLYKGTIRLNLAAEYMLDNLFASRLENDDLLPIEEEKGKRFLLVETSYFNPPMELEATLKRIQARGYYPLLAHPERYEYMNKKKYRALKEADIYFQLNLSALAGMYGEHVMAKAEMLLKGQMYDFVGMDVHSLRYLEVLTEAPVKKGIINLLRDLLTCTRKYGE